MTDVHDVADGSGLLVSSLGEVLRRGSCEHSVSNVQRVDTETFLVMLDVSVAEGADAVSLMKDSIRRWERITDGSTRDRRAEASELALRRVLGSDGVDIEGRCALREVTCHYWILVDGWLIDAQVLYFGRIDQYLDVAEMGDTLLVDVAELVAKVLSRAGS